ncbi:MAG: ArsR family transcriptional regulator [Kiritimatiellae bacterium]|nr:ArsR family transcriptional regulator [Kiritimatiellia bacterium]
MERRGSGFQKIFEDYAKNFANPGRRVPVFESHPAYFRVTLPSLVYGFDERQLAAAPPVMPPVMPPVATPVMTPVVTPVVTPVEKPSETLIDEVQRKVLVALCDGVMSTSELARAVGISQAKNMRRRYLRLLLDMRFVEYTVPQKPHSRLQKYRLTEKGRTWVGGNGGKG